MAVLTLGIDPSLNNMGLALYSYGAAPLSISPSTNRMDASISQFERMRRQADHLAKYLRDMNPSYVGIEQPYVGGVGRFGGGGHQSANMWATYNMLLNVIADFHLPVVMFNIPQWHALVLRKKGITKQDVIDAAEIISNKKMNEHEADAFMIAYHASIFWELCDGRLSASDLTKDQQDIFLSKRTGSKGDRAGIIWRPGEFWFDFRGLIPTVPTDGMKAITCL